MTQLLVSCVVLYLAILTLQTAASNDWQQQREETPIFNHIAKTRRKHQKKGVGQPCKSSNDCYSWLCCRMRGRARTCQALSRFGQYCSDDQLKGGYYLGHCPCAGRAGECHVFRGRKFGECSYARRR